MLSFEDQCGRKVELKSFPKRIVSTVPSQTELLHYLGLDEAIVGLTAYCVHPKGFLQEKAIVGGTKDLNLSKIRELKPDLIIANKEENVKDQIEELAKDIPVWISDVEDFNDGLQMIKAIGELTNSAKKAHKLKGEIIDACAQIGVNPSLRTLYFIWKEPFMVANHDTYISSILDLLKLKNIVPDTMERYPELSTESLKALDPQLILLTSEPYSFTSGDAHALAEIFPKALIKIVDGEMFTWYGNRMLNAMLYLKRLSAELKLHFNTIDIQESRLGL